MFHLPYLIMFFGLPPLSCGEEGKEVKVSFFAPREVTDEDGGTSLHLDIANVVTHNDDGEARVTHFGIQGRSDHLADLCGQGGKSKQSKDAPQDAPAAA